MTANERSEQANRNLPTAKNEDMEFSAELADQDDMEAAERADAADYRQERE